ncbi:SIR2 family protein [Nonomuraea angiospora]|uniref:SIR2 family NAD-dependent protein deacylase n=1 Tax=Nonomuraea angiospora TaxID=46172 RepID=UPI00341D7983
MLRVQEAEWARIVHQASSGDCVPFLGAGACAGVLPSGSELSTELAAIWDYPFQDHENLARVSQYALMKYDDAVFVKNFVAKRLRGYPAPTGDPTDVHALVAAFPTAVYITTNFDDFLFEALSKAGKDPGVAIYPWHHDLDFNHELFSSEWGMDPRPERPLIYHLHGTLADPASMVLTEDDYIEFLINLGGAGYRELPPVIRRALTTKSLLFIGYSLQDWMFRALLRSLQRSLPGIVRRRHLGVQLAPANSTRETRNELARYFEQWRISVYWGSAREFLAELQHRMSSA